MDFSLLVPLSDFNRKPRVIKKFIAQMQGAALEKSKELFQREAEKLDELKHEQIPTVYDYFSQGNSLYLVQEFIEGETLLQYPVVGLRHETQHNQLF
jgi:serine/threonine protein kinase